MELTVTQENLTRALGAASRVAGTKTQLPILSNILLRTDGTRLMVAATNLEIASTQHIGAKIVNEGAITVPSRLITEFVASLPKTSVTLKVKDNKLHLEAEGYSSTINGTVADDFPELPTINDKTAVSYAIDTAALKQAITQTILTTSSDSTRPVLTGVYWHSHDGGLYLAATDGYRLSEKRLVATKSDVAAIIPTSTLQEVLRTLSDDAVRVWIDGALAIDHWTPHETMPDYATITSGAHELRVQYLQVDGWSEMRLDILRGTQGKSAGSAGPH